MCCESWSRRHNNRAVILPVHHWSHCEMSLFRPNTIHHTATLWSHQSNMTLCTCHHDDSPPHRMNREPSPHTTTLLYLNHVKYKMFGKVVTNYFPDDVFVLSPCLHNGTLTADVWWLMFAVTSCVSWVSGAESTYHLILLFQENPLSSGLSNKSIQRCALLTLFLFSLYFFSLLLEHRHNSQSSKQTNQFCF